MLYHLSSSAKHIVTAFNIITYTFIILSYVQSIRIKTNLTKDIPMPRIKTQLRNNHPHYIYHNKC